MNNKSRTGRIDKKRAMTLAPVLGLLILCVHCLLSTGCSAFLRSTPAPISTRQTRFSAEGPASTLIVFLPGRGGSMDDFEREGIVEILRDAGIRADTLAVDAHLGYYFERTIIDRLQQDVLIPARQRGYRRIVLVGVSLGGLGALLNERDHPSSVDAVVLLGPYLGSKTSLFEKIAASGGPQRWAADREPRAGAVEEQLWTYLGTKSSTLPPTWLLCGAADRLGTGHRLLAKLLPADKVLTQDGGHDWPTWRGLWKTVCQNSALFSDEKAQAAQTDAVSLRDAARRQGDSIDSRESAQAAIRAWERVVAASPEDAEAWVEIGCLRLLEGAAYRTDSGERLQCYTAALQACERAMATNPEFLQRVRAGQRVREASAALGARDMGAMHFWSTGIFYIFRDCLGLFGRIVNVGKMDDAKALLTRMDSIDPTWEEHTTTFSWGIYYLAMPAARGGDKAKARECFDRAVALGQTRLLPRWGRGKYFYPAIGEKQLAKADLKTVTERSLDGLGGNRSWNRYFQAEAARLLKE